MRKKRSMLLKGLMGDQTMMINTSPVGSNGDAFFLIEASKADGVDEESGSFMGFNGDAAGDAGLDISEACHELRFFRDMFTFTYGKLDLSNHFDGNYAQTIAMPGDEQHFEFYYNVGFNDSVSVTADVQLSSARMGNKAYSNVWAWGLRSQILF